MGIYVVVNIIDFLSVLNIVIFFYNNLSFNYLRNCWYLFCEVFIYIILDGIFLLGRFVLDCWKDFVVKFWEDVL